MPDGHMRGVQTHRKDLASASEWYIYTPKGIAPTIKTKGGEHLKVMITDERILQSFMRSVKRQRF